MTSLRPSYPIVLHADREHRGVRFGVVFVLVVSFVLSFILMRFVLRQLFPGLSSVLILSCFAALPVSLLATGAGEAVLKRRWHSGREIRLGEGRIVLRRPSEDDVALARDSGLHRTHWFLPLAGYARGGRERRIASNWFCFAVQVQNDTDRIVAYTYVSPNQKKGLLLNHEAFELDPGEVYDTSFGARFRAPSRPELPADVIASNHGRYWLAEQERWRRGVELELKDYEVFLQYLEQGER